MVLLCKYSLVLKSWKIYFVASMLSFSYLTRYSTRGRIAVLESNRIKWKKLLRSKFMRMWVSMTVMNTTHRLTAPSAPSVNKVSFRSTQMNHIRKPQARSKHSSPQRSQLIYLGTRRTSPRLKSAKLSNWSQTDSWRWTNGNNATLESKIFKGSRVATQIPSREQLATKCSTAPQLSSAKR